MLRIGWHLQWHFLVPRDEVKAQLEDHPACTPGVTDVCDEITGDDVNPATGVPWAEAEGLQTGNPGFPGWSSGGWLASMGFEASWEF